MVPSRGSPEDSLLLLISETLRAGSNAPAPMNWAGTPSGVVAHGVEVVRHRDADRHRRQLAVGHGLGIVRSAGLVEDLGRQVARAVRVRAVRIRPELGTDVDAVSCRVGGPGLAAVEGPPDVEVVAVVAVAPGRPVGRQGVGDDEEVAADEAAVAADVGVHAGADLAVEHVAGGPVVMNQPVGLVAQVVVVLRPQQHLVRCCRRRRWGRPACRPPARRPPPGRCRRWSG